MIGRIVIYGSLLAVIALLATDPMTMIVGGPTILGSPGGGLSVTDPSPVYIIPIVLLIWVVLRQWKRRSSESKSED